MTTLAPSFTPPGWATLVRVEVRKCTDTRAGRALLGTLAGLAVAVLALTAFFVDEVDTFGGFLAPVVVPMLVVLPVVGVMAVTSEWSQRSAVSTFALVPRRGRVLVAKAVAVLALDLAVVAVALVVALGLFAVKAARSDAGVDLSGTGSALQVLLLVAVVTTATGLAFGSALLSTPLAITAVFLVPTVLGTVLPALTGRLAPWLSSGTWVDALFAVVSGEPVSHPAGAPVTSALLWLGSPVAIGAWRQLRREVR